MKRSKSILPCVLGICCLCLAATDLQAKDQTDPVDQSGFLFLNGSYIAGPYVVETLDEKTILINGLEISASRFDLTDFELALEEEYGRGGFGGRRRGDGNRGRFRESRPPTTAFSEFCNDLLVVVERGFRNVDAVAVLSDGRPPLFLSRGDEGLELLKILSDDSTRQTQPIRIPDSLKYEVDRETWSQLVSEFTPSASYLERASRFVNEIETTQNGNQQASDTMLLVDKLAYPLTVFAMFVVVLGFGHLLSNKPVIGRFAESGEEREHARRVVARSLLIVVLLSVIDLAMTLTAAQSGAMREMNPLGSRLIHDPMQLVLFKSVGVSVAVGILYFVHHRPVAQAASWWSCLVLTLVTARWVTFNSMFL